MRRWDISRRKTDRSVAGVCPRKLVVQSFSFLYYQRIKFSECYWRGHGAAVDRNRNTDLDGIALPVRIFHHKFCDIDTDIRAAGVQVNVSPLIVAPRS